MLTEIIGYKVLQIPVTTRLYIISCNVTELYMNVRFIIN